MKKFICCIFIILVLTGCGEKKLKCVTVEETEMYNVSENILFLFDKKGNEIKKGNFNISIEMSLDYSSYFEEYEQYVISQYDTLRYIGVNVQSSWDDSVLKVQLNYDTKSLDENQKQNLLYQGLYVFGNFDNVKKELEKDGYTCQ